MSLRLRKRIKIAPGLYFNLSASKNGLKGSASVGAPGMNINIGETKDGSIGAKRGTIGVPGSGLRYDMNLDDSSVESQNKDIKEKEEDDIKHSSSLNIYWWLTLICIVGLFILHWPS